MVQDSTPLPRKDEERILCGYRNATPQIQIARISNLSNWYFERIVFPGEYLLFEAVPKAELEIYGYQVPSALLMDKWHCEALQIREQSSRA